MLKKQSEELKEKESVCGGLASKRRNLYYLQLLDVPDICYSRAIWDHVAMDTRQCTSRQC